MGRAGTHNQCPLIIKTVTVTKLEAGKEGEDGGAL